jgi:hypothetical protein
MGQKTFGRRATGLAQIQQYPRTAVVLDRSPAQVWTAEPSSLALPPATSAVSQSVDDELREWKRERRLKHGFVVPWGPLSLMASLCFGVASFVLPDTVNDSVGWLLDALSVASMAAWLVRRHQRKPPLSEPVSRSS